MATAAPQSLPPPPLTTTTTTTTTTTNSRPAGSLESRWAKVTESGGSTFRGFTTAPRGRATGRGRASRGGSPRHIKSAPNEKANEDPVHTTSTTQSTSTTASNPLVRPVHSHVDKSPLPLIKAPSKSKETIRRTFRTIPPAQAPKPENLTEQPNSPTSSRSQHRRRRSQPSKSASAGLPKIQVRPGDDEQSQLPSVSHTAPIKDVPPHLAGASFDVRHDIDALVERVRSVAMGDNRPTTPGSHIDWAGDEDDSLPDLNDWGVNTSKPELMSPIVVEGLKPLPGVEETSPSSHLSEGKPLLSQLSSIATAVSTPCSTQVASSPRFSPLGEPISPEHSPRRSFRGSLYLPPTTGAALSQPVPSPLHKSYSAPGRKRRLSKRENKPTHPKESFRCPSAQTDENVEKKLEPFAIQEEGFVQSTHAPKVIESFTEALPLEKEAGLSASIHAPTIITESTSAPGNLPNTLTNGRPQVQVQTASRGSSRSSRPPRGPRGISVRGLHARTHSTPSVGSGAAYRNNHAQRPILTGDALSLLAKTIGSTSVSPGKTAAAVIAQE